MFKNINFSLKNHKPSSVLLLSFLLVISIGTILLYLPISRVKDLSFLDCLFASVSSTCVTGLLTIVPFSDLTLFGQIVMLIMIQIGGLGLITFIAVFLRFRKEKLGFSERKLLKDSLNKYDDADVSGYLLSVFRYTFVFEFIGFGLLLTRIYDGSAISIFRCLFLSISSFCNAGIDIMSSSSLMMYQSDVLVNIVISLLIIFGGIGFIVWVDLYINIKETIMNKYNLKIFLNKLRVHTKIVLLMTFILLVLGGVLVYLFEYNNVLVSLCLKDRILVSFFSSVTLRTAGFYSIDFGALKDVTKLFMCVFMLVGASPGGTAGGFKTTTLFLIILGTRCILSGKDEMVAYKRQITKANYMKASIIVFLYVVFMFGGLFVLTLSENIDTIDLLFEVCSAIGTVGLTAGVTTLLSGIGKIVIILLMFIGRVGPTTLLLSFTSEENNGIDYPKTDIIVG